MSSRRRARRFRVSPRAHAALLIIGIVAIAAPLLLALGGVGVADEAAAVVLASSIHSFPGKMIAAWLGVNFTIRSDFRWALLAAAGLWVASTAAAIWS